MNEGRGEGGCMEVGGWETGMGGWPGTLYETAMGLCTMKVSVCVIVKR